MNGIHLPAVNRTVPIGAYVRAVRLAKANPDATFKHGLTTWWPTTGADIVNQFRSEARLRQHRGRRITR